MHALPYLKQHERMDKRLRDLYQLISSLTHVFSITALTLEAEVASSLWQLV